MSDQTTAVRSLEEIDKEMEVLKKERASAIKSEAKQALTEVKRIVAMYGFTADQVFGAMKVRVAATAKYRNPKTGQTWSGRGRQPKWFDAGNPDQFKI